MCYRYLLASLLILLPAAAHAQDDPAPPPSGTSTLKVTTRIVALTALVRDRHGELLRSLDKDSFELREDGKPQTIRYFDRDNDLPLMIGLMIDTSGSEKHFFAEQQQASETFLHSMITRPQDKAFVVRFDTDVLLLQKSTADLDKLRSALGKLALTHAPRAGTGGGGTLLYDAICATAQQVIGKEQGRRAIIVLTDGEDNGSTASIEQAIQLAQMADTVVYTVLYTSRDDGALAASTRSLTHFKSKPSGRAVMEQISRATGGRLFAVHKDTPIQKIYQQIEEEMRMQYRLGYRPRDSKPLTYHALELSTRDHSLDVQSRTGYYTPE